MSADQLLMECLKVFNKIPNKVYGGQYATTYILAAKIEEHFATRTKTPPQQNALDLD